MKNPSGTIRNKPKPRKGIVQRVIIRAGRIGYAGVALVWAFFVAFVRFFARLFIGIVVAYRYDRYDTEPDETRYDHLGRRVDSFGQPY